jgi:polyvinyl alcohol dehydrogenase (cytochrome)
VLQCLDVDFLRLGLRSLGLVWMCLFLRTGASAAVSGEAVYGKRCAVCHEQVNPRIPPRETLRTMTAARILRSLDFGAMMSIAYPLSREEREAVAGYLGTAGKDAPPRPEAFCSDRKVKVADKSEFAWNGWSPGLANTRYQSAGAAGLTIDQVRRLKLKWAFGFEGDVTAFAQPAVLDGQVFVGSAGGMVHALRAETGCLQWVFQARGPVRSAILAVPIGRRHTLLFGDQTGWFYSLEAETGRLRWEKKVEEHDTARLTGAPVAHDGTVYVPVASWEETRSSNPDYRCCTFRGSLVALRIRDGKLAWKTYTVPEPGENGKDRNGIAGMGPSGASIWSAPTLDLKRNLIYVTTGDNFSAPATLTSDALLALDLATGRMVWSKQVTAGDVSPSERGPDFDFGSSAMLVRSDEGRDLVLAGQKSGLVYAFDPDKMGEIVWQVRVGKGGTTGGVQWGMASDGQNVYAAVSDIVGTRRPAADGVPAGRQLDPTKGGGLTALRVSDGSKAWGYMAEPCTTPGCSPAQSGAVTAIPGVVFSGSMDGYIRGFSTEDGKILWDFDTAREYQTVNGVPGKGGALDGPGAVVVKGMLFVNSGYSRFGGLPGNVLLAFGAE